MRRNIYNQLINWKNSNNRMPLLLRGARQIGKTYIVESLANNEFANYLSINFELNPEYAECFTDLNPSVIINRLELLSGKKITPSETLLFLDEIQECPKAIESLRYFKEKCPQLHVIGAGSLLEFALNNEDFRMPVGRVEFLYMYPLTFSEFLCATNNEMLLQHIKQVKIGSSVDSVAHQKLLKLLKLFFVLGGMPAVIQAYIEGETLQRCQAIQAFLLNTYRNDFGKYASLANQQHCRRIFERIPLLTAKNFKYKDVDPDVQSRELKVAMHLLMQAGLIFAVYETKATSIQLNASINEKKFKLLFLDVGLVKYASKLSIDLLTQDNLLAINNGSIAEQFVGQELIAHQENIHEAELYYWQRSSRSDSAEVDYVTLSGNTIIPIEVKAGKSGRLKSLHSFLKEKNSPFGVKISQDKFSFDGKVLSLPLYMISELNRIVGSIKSQCG